MKNGQVIWNVFIEVFFGEGSLPPLPVEWAPMQYKFVKTASIFGCQSINTSLGTILIRKKRPMIIHGVCRRGVRILRKKVGKRIYRTARPYLILVYLRVAKSCQWVSVKSWCCVSLIACYIWPSLTPSAIFPDGY